MTGGASGVSMRVNIGVAMGRSCEALVIVRHMSSIAAKCASMTTRASVDPIVQRPSLVWFADLYLAGANPRTPLAAPLYADLHGLPPLFIHVGTAETLLDDATRLAERAKIAGTEVTLEVWEEMIHVWHLFATMLPEGQQAIARIGEYIRQRTPG